MSQKGSCKSVAEEGGGGGVEREEVRMMADDREESVPLHRGSVTVGVCSMAKKVNGKPMQTILKLMKQYFGELFQIVPFPEEQILHNPVEEWPKCDCLITFHATGFPLKKAIAYCKLYPNMYVLNEPERQYDLLDRTRVYRILEKSGIDTPRHAVLRRDPKLGVDTPLVEGVDHIEVGGHVFNKPFVEKPVSAEDHNIVIYYPSSSGGGSQKLFRKVRDRSSEYSKMSKVRQEGSYIYEDFMPTDGTDCKVYAVGPDYAHAEARKSPALDGKVDRDKEGKEVRYPVILTNKEKQIARKVVLAFKQTVCGFDLLRANGDSFVCDVNGFSFVKTSKKYYEDSARILGNMILRHLASRLHIPWTPSYQPDGPAIVTTTIGKQMELRCVLGIIRHGDRTPKQKMKLETSDSRLFDLFKRLDGFKKGELKLKKPKQLQEVLDLARILSKECHSQLTGLYEQAHAFHEEGMPDNSDEVKRVKKQLDSMEEMARKWDQVRGVLEMYGYFTGINRKVQLKHLATGPARKSSDSDSDIPGQPSLRLVLKWGGELTKAGKSQAHYLGHLFRTLYPGIETEDGGDDTQGLGFLRLHSTYRHDLKIYASDEGRVQMTAAAFAKGLLHLEGPELAPIVSQLVKSANTDGLLDDDYDARKFQAEMKGFLHEYLQVDRELTSQDMEQLNPLESSAVRKALEKIVNPRQMCENIFSRIRKVCGEINQRKRKCEAQRHTFYMEETWELVERRWLKLMRDFRRAKRDDTVIFEISKIPDLYDNVRYDLQHNHEIFLEIDETIELYNEVKLMAEVVVPQEYGIKKPQKLAIAQGICIPLMKKLRVDLLRCTEGSMELEDENLTRLDPRASQEIASPFRHVRTRLYFTSESHIHSVMNLLRHGGLFDPASGMKQEREKELQRAKNFLSITPEYNYMSQIVLLMYEDTTKDEGNPDRFHVELAFSPGLCQQKFGKAHVGAKPTGKYRAATRNSKVSSSTDIVPPSDSSDTGGTLEEASELEDIEEMQLEDCDVVSLRDFMMHEKPTNEQLAKHSPPGTPRDAEESAKPAPGPVIKCLSEVAVAGLSTQAERIEFQVEKVKKPNHKVKVHESPATLHPPQVSLSSGKRKLRKHSLVEVSDSRGSRHSAFSNRHHTVNLLQDNNRLLSTAVISGYLPNGKDSKTAHEVLVRGASAPDLKKYADDANGRLPPLYSLETLQNQLSLKIIEDFLEKITTIRTPIPSPPKTPQVKISRENSSLGDSAVEGRIEAVSEKLNRLTTE